MYVGGQHYEAEHVLSYMWRLMKRFPDLKAQEILWSFFIPNEEALKEAQENGSPNTLSEVTQSVLIGTDHETQIEEDCEPCSKYGFYRLSIKDVKKHGHHRPHHVVVVARSSTQARSIAAREIRRFEAPVTYGKDKLWEDTKAVSVSLLFPFLPSSTCQSRFIPSIVCASDPLNYKLAKNVETEMIKAIREKILKEVENEGKGDD